MTTELKPCPFCGGEVDPEGWISSERKGPECEECGATANGVMQWNTRAMPDMPELDIVAHMVEVEDTDCDGERFKKLSHSYLGYPNAFPVVRRDQAAAMLAAKNAEIEEAENSLSSLLVNFVKEHFPKNENFQPLSGLQGLILQLDNAVTITRGFKRRAEDAETDNKRLREALEPFVDHAKDRDVDDAEWRNTDTIRTVATVGQLRKARAALEGSKT